MRLFRRRIRTFFLLQGLILAVQVVHSLLKPTPVDYGMPPVRHFAFVVAYCLLSMIFATAWWTTRKPSTFRNDWAMAASFVSIGAGIYILCNYHNSLPYAAPGLIALVLGVGGLYLYSQGGTSPRRESTASQKQKFQTSESALISGTPSNEEPGNSSTIASAQSIEEPPVVPGIASVTTIAVGVTAVSVDSAAIARYDPLQFVRTAAALEKLRS